MVFSTDLRAERPFRARRRRLESADRLKNDLLAARALSQDAEISPVLGV
jgi:hypothetical protein